LYCGFLTHVQGSCGKVLQIWQTIILNSVSLTLMKYLHIYNITAGNIGHQKALLTWRIGNFNIS